LKRLSRNDIETIAEKYVKAYLELPVQILLERYAYSEIVGTFILI